MGEGETRGVRKEPPNAGLCGGHPKVTLACGEPLAESDNRDLQPLRVLLSFK